MEKQGALFASLQGMTLLYQERPDLFDNGDDRERYMSLDKRDVLRPATGTGLGGRWVPFLIRDENELDFEHERTDYAYWPGLMIVFYD